MKPENRQPETDKFKLVAIRPSVYQQLKLHCAHTGGTIVDVASQAILGYLDTVAQEQPPHG